MSDKSYSVSFTVDQTPKEVFEAVINPRAWWSENIDGNTNKVGAEFTFHHKDLHYSTHKITDFVPSKKVVWHTTDSQINFVEDTQEWTGTDIIFEISEKDGKTELNFTHVGLTPTLVCYGDCSGAWDWYVGESLRQLITAGKGQPEPKEK